MCVSAVLGLASGGTVTYFSFEDYYYKIEQRNRAKVRLDWHVQQHGEGLPEWYALKQAYEDARREAWISQGLAAGAAGVTVSALIGAAVVCAPFFVAPTP
jgi:hypothetical protein